jgi:hypothetical protein
MLQFYSTLLMWYCQSAFEFYFLKQKLLIVRTSARWDKSLVSNISHNKKHSLKSINKHGSCLGGKFINSQLIFFPFN